ncbi:MAG: helix-turn-helix transcriptional regulator [Nocardiopsaceae bacterium]|nr:helix-turn-helix transcriptional regulator [Nocardiopsaceae bacterium]
MAVRRPRLAGRRKALGYTQEFLAEQLGVDRTTVGRWERGETDPFPYLRRKLCQVLKIPPGELDALLNPAPQGHVPSARPGPGACGQELSRTESLETTDDMHRRELLRLLSIAGVLVSVPAAASGELPPPGRTRTVAGLGPHAQLNEHLWQVFALATSKRQVYPLVRDQLGALVTEMKSSPPGTVHRQLCVLACDLFQLAGEIFFDADEYGDAAHCYALAASAGREARSWDRWACALTRQSFVHIYDKQYDQAADVLEAASRVARNGDSQLPTRQWVAAVQAQALADIGDASGCQRNLDTADSVLDLAGPARPGGWLRFDGTRLGEERGTCYLALGRAGLAESELNSALAGTVSPRRRGSILADLAMIGVQHKDTSQILHYADDAIGIAEQTRSAGYLGRKLTGLQEQIQPLLADSRLGELNDRISRLTAAT